MKHKPKIPVVWSDSELDIIRNNYFQMTWQQLVKAVNQIKPGVSLQAIRHQCVRMNLKKQIQIRWSKEDIQFLIDNYKTMGNVEIAEILTKSERAYRMINGVKVTRVFIPRNVEKKMNLLGLIRTEDDLKSIIQHNRDVGRGYRWTKENNVYSLGHKTVCPDGEIRVWGRKGQYKYIKVDGRFIPYARHLYEQLLEPIPDGYNVCFRDGNTLNCSPENLFLAKRENIIRENYYQRYPKELRDLIWLKIKLKRQINKQEKDECI